MKDKQISIGVFIDGGYYAKIDEGLKRSLSMQVNLSSLLAFIRRQISAKYQVPYEDC